VVQSKPTIIEATLTHKNYIFNKGGGQVYDYTDWLSGQGGGNIFLFTSSNVTDIRELIRYGDQRNVNVFHMVPMYKMNKQSISVNFVQLRYLFTLFGDHYNYGDNFIFDKNFNIPR